MQIQQLHIYIVLGKVCFKVCAYKVKREVNAHMPNNAKWGYDEKCGECI